RGGSPGGGGPGRGGAAVWSRADGRSAAFRGGVLHCSAVARRVSGSAHTRFGGATKRAHHVTRRRTGGGGSSRTVRSGRAGGSFIACGSGRRRRGVIGGSLCPVRPGARPCRGGH